MAAKWRDVRGTFSPEDEERIRKSVEKAAGVMRDSEGMDNGEKMASLRCAIDSGLASGIAESGVFDRIRRRCGLPKRNR